MVTEPQALPEHGVTVVFVDVGNTKIELLEPLGDASPIAAFLEKNPSGGMHHVCYEVDDILPPETISGRLAHACLATAIQRSARTASQFCSCIRRISSVR